MADKQEAAREQVLATGIPASMASNPKEFDPNALAGDELTAFQWSHEQRHAPLPADNAKPGQAESVEHHLHPHPDQDSIVGITAQHYKTVPGHVLNAGNTGAGMEPPSYEPTKPRPAFPSPKKGD